MKHRTTKTIQNQAAVEIVVPRLFVTEEGQSESVSQDMGKVFEAKLIANIMSTF